jgi:hypothetical protein
MAVFINFGANIAVTFTLEPMLEALTPPGIFGLYAVLTLVSLAFVAIVVPETKGKTLEEIEEDMTGVKRECDPA